MTKKQRRAQRRAKAQQARHKAVRRAVATHQHSSSLAHLRAPVEPAERFEVNTGLAWHVVRTLPRWDARAAAQIRKAGIPVFEAREVVNRVLRNRLVTAHVPVLRRLLFVGISRWQDLALVESHPGVLDDVTGYRRGGLLRGSDHRPIVIPAGELQGFADCITGHGDDVEKAKTVLDLIGLAVRVTDGPFVSYGGTVEDADPKTGRISVGINLFGRITTVDLSGKQVEAA
jgi:transcriptional antiterminator NusG